ncbi:MAG: (Fe-S)-binding protein [Halioglobus sp.]
MTEHTDGSDRVYKSSDNSLQTPKVALFVTCLADLFRPCVAQASIQLLENAGCEVSVPLSQTCCGQPAYNSGDYKAAIPIARATIELLSDAQYVVVPSGSCAGMLRHHYPRLLKEDPQWLAQAQTLAEKTFELTQFLHDVMGVKKAAKTGINPGIMTYHDSCAGLRELDISQQPRALLKALNGVDIVEMQDTASCCGFGGTFCAKMPEISAEMADAKLNQVQQTGAAVLAGGDLGCLMQLAGRAQRKGQDIEVRHVAEILAGTLEEPAIGESQT